MSEEHSTGIWFIIILFILGAAGILIAGIIALASPMTIINMARQFGIANILNSLPIVSNFVGIDIFSGNPLLSALPGLGVLAIIVSIVILIDIWGLWTLKGWAWILTVLISIVMIVAILGIIYLWILFKEDTKMAYGQL